MNKTIDRYEKNGQLKKKSYRRQPENLNTIGVDKEKKAKLFDTVSRDKQTKILEKVPEGASSHKYYVRYGAIETK